MITGIEKKDGDIYIQKGIDSYLRIVNGEILEGENGKIYPYEEDQSSKSIVLANELYRIKDKFEVHFLIQNYNDLKEELWYLTIRGTDILEYE